MLLRHWKKTNRFQVPEIINDLYHHHQLTSSNSSSRSLLLDILEVAVVVDSAADCGGGGDGHLYVAVVFVVGVTFYLACTYIAYQVKCFYAHRLSKNALPQGYCTCAIIGLTACMRFNKLNYSGVFIN